MGGAECKLSRHDNKIRLYVAEQQQLLREAYLSAFASQSRIEVVGSSDGAPGDPIERAVNALKPDVVLLGGKVFQPETVSTLAAIREVGPDVALVLLASSYDAQGIRALREFARGNSAGCAFLLKHNIDTAEQISQVGYSVFERRIIVDPELMGGLLGFIESSSSLIGELSPRELEVLSWMARGYRNDTVAKVLGLDPKTVERHINSIYSKVGRSPDSRNQRVHATMLYMRAIGLLAQDQSLND